MDNIIDLTQNITYTPDNDISSETYDLIQKIKNSTQKIIGNIASLAEYTTGSGTITLPASFTHILILMGGGGGGGGGSDGTGYGSGGGGAGAFVMAIRAKSELTGTTLNYTVGNGGAGGTAGNPGSNGSATTLTGSGVNLTAGQGYGGHRGTSVRGGNTGYGGTPITQNTNDIGITGAVGGNYNSGSGYPVQTSTTFFGIGKGGINGPDQGAGYYDGVGGSAAYLNNNYLSSLDGTSSGGGGVGGYHSLTGGNGAKGFIKIYYFYN